MTNSRVDISIITRSLDRFWRDIRLTLERMGLLPPFVKPGRLLVSPGRLRILSLPQKPRRPPASRRDVEKVLREVGAGPEAETLEAVKQRLPGKNVPRVILRQAFKDLFGPGKRGRPPKTRA